MHATNIMLNLPTCEVNGVLIDLKKAITPHLILHNKWGHDLFMFWLQYDGNKFYFLRMVRSVYLLTEVFQLEVLLENYLVVIIHKSINILYFCATILFVQLEGSTSGDK